MSNVTALPGVHRATASGEPRPDMAQMLRDLADRADAGEIDTLALGFTTPDGAKGSAVSTPENDLVSLLGALEEAKFKCWERRPAHETIQMSYDP